MGIKNLVSKAFFLVDPYWDEIGWNRQHDSRMRAAGLTPRKRKSVMSFAPRTTHVLIVPQNGPSGDNFFAGQWNIYYEATKALEDLIGAENVTVFDVPAVEQPAVWQQRLVDQVTSTGATHVLTHIESDPATTGNSWTWDEAFIRLLDSGWDGVLLGVNFDSAFKWIRARSRRLARMSPQFVSVDICMPMDGELVRSRSEVGPVNMPVSSETLALLAPALVGVEKVHDVSFIGALYPYRVELIESLRSRGINVAVNPHRSDETTDFESSRANQPTWIEYMQGLASSHMTINFSRSSAGPYEQLKTRVIEAGLAGTYLLTDDQDRTRLFFPPEEFSTFNSVEDLPDLIESLLRDRADLDARARRAQVRARELAVTNFWSGIDQGLVARGLPRIFS
jgi:hypothetical protein